MAADTDIYDNSRSQEKYDNATALDSHDCCQQNAALCACSCFVQANEFVIY